jgi:hypothetical protein
MDHFIEQYLEICQHLRGWEELQTVSECVVDLCSSKPPFLSHQTSSLIAIPPPTNLALQIYWPLPMVEDTPVNLEWSRSPSSILFTNVILAYFNMLRGGGKGRSYHAL